MAALPSTASAGCGSISSNPRLPGNLRSPSLPLCCSPRCMRRLTLQRRASFALSHTFFEVPVNGPISDTAAGTPALPLPGGVGAGFRIKPAGLNLGGFCASAKEPFFGLAVSPLKKLQRRGRQT